MQMMQHTMAPMASAEIPIEMDTSAVVLNPSGFKLKRFRGSTSSGDDSGVESIASVGETARVRFNGRGEGSATGDANTSGEGSGEPIAYGDGSVDAIASGNGSGDGWMGAAEQDTARRVATSRNTENLFMLRGCEDWLS